MTQLQNALSELTFEANLHAPVRVVALKQRIAEIESQARRYRAMRAMALMPTEGSEAEHMEACLDDPALQPPSECSPAEFDKAYDALFAAASEKCPTIAAALNLEI